MVRNRNRRGISAVQWIVIAGALVLVIVASVRLIGIRTNNKLGQTVTDVGNPKNLTTRFPKKK
jgi:hypothetical protein